MNPVVSQKRALAPCVAALTLLVGSAVMGQDFNGDGISDIAIGTPGEDVGLAIDAGVVTIMYGGGPALGLQAVGIPAVRITQATFGLDPVESGDRFGAALAWGDFNGDPFDDLAIGAPGEDHPLSGVADTGMVIVLYGTPGGLVPMHPPIWVQDPVVPPAMPLGDPGETGDDFGFALAAGDFDGNGLDDLAIGVPGEDDPLGTVDVGIVHALYGMPGMGLVVLAPPVIWQGGWPFGDPSEAGDRFGEALAVGDFDLDGAADLAIGAPYENFAGKSDVGMVNVAHGLVGVGIVPGGGIAQTWTQNSPGVPEVCDKHDHFGASLAAGNFDIVLGDDLAIGVPGEDVGAAPIVDAGCVNVIYSAGFGIGLAAMAPPAPQAVEIWHQNTPGVPEAIGAGDVFGWALAAGDFNGDQFDDLAIGVPGEDVGAAPIMDAGCVNVIYGAPPPFGLDAFFSAPAQVWTQNSAAVPDFAEVGDGMGAALTAGDYDVNFCADLSIGVPGETIGVNAGAGCVMTLYGNPGVGLLGAGPIASQCWHQNVPGVPDNNEPGDGFGDALDNDD